MKNQNNKTEEQFIKEVEQLKNRITELEKSESEIHKVEEDLRVLNQQLVVSEAHYRQLFNLLPFGGEVINKEGKIINCSQSTSRMLGYKIDEIIGKHITNFVDEETVNIFKNNFSKLLKGESLKLEVCMKHKNGTLINILRVAEPILNADGEFEYMLALNVDITERKQIEEKLRVSAEKYKSLFEESTDPVLIYKNRRFVDCNQATVDMLGFKSKEQFLNCMAADLSPEFQPDGRQSEEKSAEMNAIALKNGHHRFEWSHKRANGEEFFVDVMLTAIKSTDEAYFHVIWRDITDRKNVEEKLKKRMSELEIFNEAAIDREIMINNLRKEINELLKKSGDEMKYDVVE